MLTFFLTIAQFHIQNQNTKTLETIESQRELHYIFTHFKKMSVNAQILLIKCTQIHFLVK